MMSPKYSILFALFYSLFIAFRSDFSPFDLLPTLFLLWINRSALISLIVSILKIQLFLLLIALSVYLLDQNLEYAKTILVRSLLIVSFTYLLFRQKDGFFIYRGLVELKTPNKFSSLFLFTLKHIEIIKSEYQKIKQALKARAFIKTTDIATYKIYAHMIGMLTYRVLSRSQSLTLLLKSRDYRGELYSFYEDRSGKDDKILLILLLLQLLLFLKGAI